MKSHRTSIRRCLIAAALAASAMALFAGAASAGSATPDSPKRGNSCFFITQWRGWSSPSPDVLYLRVNNNDIYRVGLSVGSSQLQWPSMHLVSINRGSSSICSAIDLDLKIADTNGFSTPLIARSLVKLTPEEAAAIPRKFIPG